MGRGPPVFKRQNSTEWKLKKQITVFSLRTVWINYKPSDLELEQSYYDYWMCPCFISHCAQLYTGLEMFSSCRRCGLGNWRRVIYICSDRVILLCSLCVFYLKFASPVGLWVNFFSDIFIYYSPNTTAVVMCKMYPYRERKKIEIILFNTSHYSW